MQNTLIDELGETVDYFIHQDYTTVKYRVVADIPMQKINAQNEEEGIKDITFRLYGTSRFGNEVDEYITTGNRGLATFKSIEAGEYILQEYSENRDWVEDHTEHFVTINMDRSVYVDNVQITKENVLKIANIPRAHTDVLIYKKDLVNKLGVVEGVKLKLSGTSDYGNEILVYGVSDNFGKVFFEDIEKGKYKLEEVSTVEGYTLNEYNKETFRVIIDENSNYNVEKLIDATNESYETTYVNGRYEIYNEPLHGFYFMKKDLIDINKGVSGVSFKITGTSDYGNYFEKTATSDETGKVTFEGIEKGTYTLWETETTSEYVLNTDTYTVQIDKMGDFTITENHLAGELEKHIAKIDGKYSIYNEPKHSFYFIKKDSYNNEKLGNAKFKLYGSSNIGNVYDEEVVSSADTGAVEFTNLESGTYFLKEIEVPNTEETSFVPDEKERIVEITEDGKVKLDDELIWPLEERTEGEPYAWLNTRNKGQITITKKWVDNLSNDQRQEPKIFISTLNNEASYSKVYFRTADSSHSIVDYVTSENVAAFKRNISLNEAEVTAKQGVTRLDNNYEDINAKYKIYAWVENGTLYWWTKADRAVLPANLDYYFQNESGLTDISWNTIYKNGLWTGDVNEEQIVASITNMQNMFYGCEAIENLNISWFDNSGITEETKANMQYAFGNNGDSPEGSMSALKYITVGNNFKVFDTSILPKGNWKNQTTEEKKKNTELTGTLDAGTYEWSIKNSSHPFGREINYVTTVNGVTLNDWNVFYKDGDYTYLIYHEYLPSRAVPEFTGKKNGSEYGVYASTRAELIDGLYNLSNWSELLKGTLNGNSIDYSETSDTNICAMGAPTLKLWVDSWNMSYPEDYIYTREGEVMSDELNGWYVGEDNNQTISTSVSFNEKEGKNDVLYFPTHGGANNNGYWLSTPSAQNENNVCSIYRSGGVGSWKNGFDSYARFMAARPVICLPSSILEIEEEPPNGDELPQVGSIVHYSPSGSYEWNNGYASSYSTNVDYLSSAEDGEYRITEWRILNIDNETGKIDMVPIEPAGKVCFHGGHGYNNAVYLLNEACSNLYSDSSKGITARSINMDDFENIMREAGNAGKIQKPIDDGYIWYSSYMYPVIYGQEKLSGVNAYGSLGLSEQNRLIERSEGTSTESNIGQITGSNRYIRRYDTSYGLSYEDFYTSLGSKRKILLPKGTSTDYWIASRCIWGAYFSVRKIQDGDLSLHCLSTFSGPRGGAGYSGIFPIVSVNSEHLKAKGSNEFEIE